MAGTIQGTGNTNYDAPMERVRNSFLPGGIVPNSLSFSDMIAKITSGEVVPISLKDVASGRDYIICGFSKVGGNEICG